MIQVTHVELDTSHHTLETVKQKKLRSTGQWSLIALRELLVSYIGTSGLDLPVRP